MTQPTDPQVTAWLDQEDAHAAQLIRRRRFTMTYVAAGDGPGEPAFAYTTGMFGLGHPELVVTGLDESSAADLLERTAALVIAGRDFVPGEQLSAPELPGAVVVVEVLPNGGEILFAANRFYGRPDTASVPAYQLTWADAGGAFPWDSGYTAGESSQPRPGTWRA